MESIYQQSIWQFNESVFESIMNYAVNKLVIVNWISNRLIAILFSTDIYSQLISIQLGNQQVINL